MQISRTKNTLPGYRISLKAVEIGPEKVLAVVVQAVQVHHVTTPKFPWACKFLPEIHPIVFPNSSAHHQPLKDKGGGKTQTKRTLKMDNGMLYHIQKPKCLSAAKPILKHLDPSTSFVIQAHSSDVAVGAVLLQKNDQGVLQPYVYSSKGCLMQCEPGRFGRKRAMQCSGCS